LNIRVSVFKIKPAARFPHWRTVFQPGSDFCEVETR
jgi:hypothetical protein